MRLQQGGWPCPQRYVVTITDDARHEARRDAVLVFRSAAVGDSVLRPDSLPLAGVPPGTGRRGICLRGAVDAAGHTSLPARLQHEVARDLRGVLPGPRAFRANPRRDSS